jgi:hypothetical protein
MTRSHLRDRQTALALTALAVTPVAVAWTLSQASSEWATRYLAVALPPLLVLAGCGLARAGNLGLAGTLLLVLLWMGASPPTAKSNAHYVAHTLDPALRSGDLVISTQPEQVPVLSYYLRSGLRYANPLGPVRDTRVVDWRNGAQRLENATAARELEPLIARMKVGAHVVLVRPIIVSAGRWRAPWTRQVAGRSIEWEGLMRADPRLQLETIVPDSFGHPGPNALEGLLFRRVASAATLTSAGEPFS